MKGELRWLQSRVDRICTGHDDHELCEALKVKLLEANHVCLVEWHVCLHTELLMSRHCACF